MKDKTKLLITFTRNWYVISNGKNVLINNLNSLRNFLSNKQTKWPNLRYRGINSKDQLNILMS